MSPEGEEKCCAVSRCDSKPPETNVTAPSDWVNHNVDLTIGCNDAGHGCNFTYYCVNQGSKCNPTSGTSSPPTHLTVSQEGVNYVCYYSTDNASNKEPARCKTVKIDKTDPVVSDNAPTDWKNHSVDVTVECDDSQPGHKVSKCHAIYTCVNSSDTCSPSVDVVTKNKYTQTISNEDKNYLRYKAKDKAGNIASVKSVPVKIDYTSPDVTCKTPSQKPGNLMTVEAEVDDNRTGINDSGYDHLKVCGDINCNTVFCTANSPDQSCTFDLSDYFDRCEFISDRKYIIRAWDLAGNSNFCQSSFTKKMPIGCTCSYDIQCISGDCLGSKCYYMRGPNIFIG